MVAAQKRSDRRCVPGLYAAIYRRAAALAAELDPRVEFMAEPHRSRMAAKDFTPARRRAKAGLDLDRMERGEPIVLPRWRFHGRRLPDATGWAGYENTVAYRVYSNDEVEAIYG